MQTYLSLGREVITCVEKYSKSVHIFTYLGELRSGSRPNSFAHVKTASISVPHVLNKIGQ